jgi:hypothetical protein
MTRVIAIFVLLVALLSFAVLEQVFIGKVYGKMLSETIDLINIVNATPEGPDKKTLFDQYTKIRVNELHDYWIKSERKMCIITRHIELSYISDALIYARNFIHYDNKEEACAGLERLKYLIEAYSHVYGLNTLNIL